MQTTIKNRIIRLYLFMTIAVSVLIGAYSWQIISLEKKVTTLEDFHNLFDNVLEVRRYEKNFFLNVGTENLENITSYLEKIEQEMNHLGSDITRVAGPEARAEFQKILDEYSSALNASSVRSSVIPEEVRNHGTILVDYAHKFLSLKQERIRQGLKWTMFGYIVVTGGFFLMIMLVFTRQVMSILQRTAFLQQATKDILEDNFTPIKIVSSGQDEITALIKAFNNMAAELSTKQEQLIQAKKLAAIGTFSSGIAHELNNPLNNISLSADTLLEEYGELDDDDAKDILADIIAQTDRASKIVRNLLDFSRDKAPVTTRLNLKDVTEATLKLIANQLRINSIWVEDYIPESLPPINGDFQKLQQVFLNLFLNAIQVMPGGGLIYLEASCEAEFVCINVGDTGTGIDSAHVDHIFDPFYTTKEVGQGTGLGLSIVYGILKKHGGYVEVKSKMNIGTTFSVYLPMADQTLEKKALEENEE